MKAIHNYRERRPGSMRDRLRRAVRNTAILGLSIPRSIPTTSSWIRFPYYHHVFDDERKTFETQLRYLRNFGDFMSMDDAADYLGSDAPPAGRYFCLTFDDGFENSLTNAAPILIDGGAVAAFFVPTRFIGLSSQSDDPALAGFYERLITPPVEMMTWDDCRRLAVSGMTIGSHGVSHTKMAEMSAADIERELRESKATIEAELGTECRHFCAPYGMPAVDFDPARDPQLASWVGYRTFLTTRRGSHRRRPSPLGIERDLMVAAWPTYQLRYFLSR